MPEVTRILNEDGQVVDILVSQLESDIDRRLKIVGNTLNGLGIPATDLVLQFGDVTLEQLQEELAQTVLAQHAEGQTAC